MVAASFHPERANVFLLAFADGALAVYDAGHLFQNAGKGERRSGPAGTGKGGEIGHVRGLHAAGATSIPSDSIALLNAAALGGYDEGTKTVSVGSRSSGVTAIAFIPGYRARAISAGADGKCSVVDFDGSNKKKGRIVKSWHVRGPATSLSVVPLNGDLSLGQLDRPGTTGSERNPAIAIRERLIAVGRLDGKVCFFDNSGTLMGEKTVDSAGGRIVDVEWMDGSGDQLSKTHSGVLSSPAKSSDSAAMSTRTVKAKRESVARSKRKSLGSILAAGRQVEEELVTVAYEDNEGAESVTLAPAVEMSGALLEPSLHSSQGSPSPTVWQDVIEPYTANYMDLFSPVKQKESQRNSNYVAASPRKRKSASGRKGLPGGAVSNSQSSVSPSQPDFSKALRRESRSSIRPRPIPCQGAQMSMRRAHTARRASQDDGKVIAGIRRATVPGKPAKGFALFAPYMQRKVMKDGNEAVGISPSTAHAIAAQRPETSSQADEDVWAEVTGGPTIPPRRRSQKSATTASRKSRKTVSFQPSSTTEASDDTIIDWQNGQPQPTPPVSGPPQIFSQARNSNSYGRETTTSNDTVVQRFSSKKSPPEFQVHQDHPGRFRTSPSPHVRSATVQVETPKATPLIETSHNLTCATSSPLKSETSNKSKQHTGSRCDSHVLEEKLEEAKRSLRDEMRSFQTEMLKQFQAHQKRMEDALSKESSERQRVAEENRLLKEELSKERRRKC